MIHVFHGFLGSPDDFSFLKNEDTKIYDLYQMVDEPLIRPEDIMIGYSMGGRIALELAYKNNFNITKLFLLNAHPGLSTEKEKESRKVWEDNILQDLKKKSKDNFLKDWNKLPVFLFDEPLLSVDEDRFQMSPAIFNRYRLSNQMNFTSVILENKDKIRYVIGTLDEKYMDLSRDLVSQGVQVDYIEAGHRLFQHPEKLKSVLSF